MYNALSSFRHSLGGSGSPQSHRGEYHSSQGDSHGFRGLAPGSAYGSYNSPSGSPSWDQPQNTCSPGELDWNSSSPYQQRSGYTERRRYGGGQSSWVSSGYDQQWSSQQAPQRSQSDEHVKKAVVNRERAPIRMYIKLAKHRYLAHNIMLSLLSLLPCVSQSLSSLQKPAYVITTCMSIIIHVRVYISQDPFRLNGVPFSLPPPTPHTMPHPLPSMDPLVMIISHFSLLLPLTLPPGTTLTTMIR